MAFRKSHTSATERGEPRRLSGPDAITQPYAIDPTDGALGYHDDGFTASGLPRFSGHYDKWDGGYKLAVNGTPTVNQRKFYESSLTDGQFRALLDDNWTSQANPDRGEVDAVLFTNHLLAGYAPHSNHFYQFGSMVARDDAFLFQHSFWSDHDPRLSGNGSGGPSSSLVGIGLPVSVGRPKLLRWKECPADAHAACP